MLLEAFEWLPCASTRSILNLAEKNDCGLGIVISASYFRLSAAAKYHQICSIIPSLRDDDTSFKLLRQSNRKYGAAFGGVRDGQGTAVFGDHSMGQGQADAVASGFGCEERNENLL